MPSIKDSIPAPKRPDSNIGHLGIIRPGVRADSSVTPRPEVGIGNKYIYMRSSG